jgi:hypothetical protein
MQGDSSKHSEESPFGHLSELTGTWTGFGTHACRRDADDPRAPEHCVLSTEEATFAPVMLPHWPAHEAPTTAAAGLALVHEAFERTTTRQLRRASGLLVFLPPPPDGIQRAEFVSAPANRPAERSTGTLVETDGPRPSLASVVSDLSTEGASLPCWLAASGLHVPHSAGGARTDAERRTAWIIELFSVEPDPELRPETRRRERTVLWIETPPSSSEPLRLGYAQRSSSEPAGAVRVSVATLLKRR